MLVSSKEPSHTDLSISSAIDNTVRGRCETVCVYG